MISTPEFVYTPKHGNRLNMAEPEFTTIRRQCLDRRIRDEGRTDSRSMRRGEQVPGGYRFKNLRIDRTPPAIISTGFVKSPTEFTFFK